MTNNRRIIQHHPYHVDIEELRTDLDGVEVWAVIYCSEDEMTPRRPIELVKASQDCAEAWLKRDAMIDAGDTVGVKAMDLTCDILDERYQKIYREWQILGGTSNIESIALPLPAEHYEGTPKGSELKFGNVVFDLNAMGENARQRSEVLKAQIDQRRVDAKARRKADIDRVRKANVPVFNGNVEDDEILRRASDIQKRIQEVVE